MRIQTVIGKFDIDTNFGGQVLSVNKRIIKGELPSPVLSAAQRTGLPLHLILSGLKVSTMKLSIIFGSALLVVAVASMDPASRESDAVEERMLPLAYYAGTAVAPEIYTSLVAAYGAWMVFQYNIRQKTASSAVG